MNLADQHKTLLRDRVTALAREVGTLLLAFAPLDYSLQRDVDPWSLGLFVLVGIGLFVASVRAEIGR